MLHFLFFAVLAAVVWRAVAPRSHFIDMFAMLLERPERAQRGLFDRLRGAESVGGEHEKRPTTLVLRYKRGRHRMGYLTVGMATASPQRLQIKGGAGGLGSVLELFSSSPSGGPSKLSVQTNDAHAAEKWLSRPDVRKAVDALIGRHELSLAVEGGWLRATWMPMGFFIFPGKFDPEKWRDVLAHMHVLTAALDETVSETGFRQSPVSPGGSAHLPA